MHAPLPSGISHPIWPSRLPSATRKAKLLKVGSLSYLRLRAPVQIVHPFSNCSWFSLRGEAQVKLMGSDLSHGVDGLFLGFVVSPGEDLRRKPQAQKLNASHNKYGGREQQRAVLQHDSFVQDHLLEDQERANESAGAAREQSEETEKMQRPCRVIK